MAQYFADCKTLDELRIAYRKLAAIHHPDVGGDVATMQAINAEHDRVFEALKAAHNASADEYHQTTETPEEFRRVVVELLKLSGLNYSMGDIRRKYGSYNVQMSETAVAV